MNLAFCALTYSIRNFYRSFAYQIMESFKKGGFGGAKMFTKDDLEGLSAEDMAQKVILQIRTVACVICHYLTLPINYQEFLRISLHSVQIKRQI